jgi:hypothetical protein
VKYSVIKNRKYDLVCEVFNELWWEVFVHFAVLKDFFFFAASCGTVVLKQSSFTVKKRTDNKSYDSASIIDSWILHKLKDISILSCFPDQCGKYISTN